MTRSERDAPAQSDKTEIVVNSFFALEDGYRKLAQVHIGWHVFRHRHFDFARPNLLTELVPPAMLNEDNPELPV